MYDLSFLICRLPAEGAITHDSGDTGDVAGGGSEIAQKHTKTRFKTYNRNELLCDWQIHKLFFFFGKLGLWRQLREFEHFIDMTVNINCDYWSEQQQPADATESELRWLGRYRDRMVQTLPRQRETHGAAHLHTSRRSTFRTPGL